MVDHAVGLDEVAVAVDVALVLEVVVGPREVGLRLGEACDRVDRQLAGAQRVVGVALHVLERAGHPLALVVLVAAVAPYQASEWGTLTQGVAAPLTV